jgi:hypothetical protein
MLLWTTLHILVLYFYRCSTVWSLTLHSHQLPLVLLLICRTHREVLVIRAEFSINRRKLQMILILVLFIRRTRSSNTLRYHSIILRTLGYSDRLLQLFIFSFKLYVSRVTITGRFKFRNKLVYRRSYIVTTISLYISIFVITFTILHNLLMIFKLKWTLLQVLTVSNLSTLTSYIWISCLYTLYEVCKHLSLF